ncbi:endonuclease/exonuclease/phosphatase family protein [Roseibium sp. MMSF_3544]|uniref:endonuclease/exonuclease/phosphatase family protein n=1 Tax=unclassified Roseibium TaxID=2629323 RepID=UPI00273F3D5F|nr:endonuclease/exonuclease/phosphatase family protein [Roseibium sp. MMSF_3544]
MGIKVTCWNVKEFGKIAKTQAAMKRRVKGVAEHIKLREPDIFGVLEVDHIDILQFIEDEFPEYDFGFTEGLDEKNKASKEILVGWRRSEDLDQVTFSQKRQFNLYNPYLRPGALLSFRIKNSWHNILFLHTDSGTEARDFGNRYEMFDKVWSLRKALDKKVGNRRERLIVVGDLNTMGLQYPTSRKADLIIDGSKEISALEQFAEKNAMRLVIKSHDTTWRKLGKNWESNLDHVMASNVVDFKKLGKRGNDGKDFEVFVDGWVDKDEADREAFIEKLSDHCSLSFEIET